MLKQLKNGLLEMTQTKALPQPLQVPHRAPVPQWAHGEGEEGSAREGETRPASALAITDKKHDF